jgi:hypothetical protein
MCSLFCQESSRGTGDGALRRGSKRTSRYVLLGGRQELRLVAQMREGRNLNAECGTINLNGWANICILLGLQSIPPCFQPIAYVYGVSGGISPGTVPVGVVFFNKHTRDERGFALLPEHTGEDLAIWHCRQKRSIFKARGSDHHLVRSPGHGFESHVNG